VLDIKAFDLQRVLQQHDPKFGELRPERGHDPRVGALTMLAKAPLQLEAVKTYEQERSADKRKGFLLTRT
jgi:hypothetical protein